MDDDHAHVEPTVTGSAKPRYVHPSAEEHFVKYPWVRRIPIYGEICEGLRSQMHMVPWDVLLYVQRSGGLFLRNCTNPMLRQYYGLEPQEYQRLALISSLGWSMKALPAMLCDTFSFFGYTKRWYMFLACVLGAAVTVIYALLPGQRSSARIAAVCIFLSCNAKAVVDILSEGFYSRLMRRNPEPGAALVSWIWWYIILGSLISSAVVGPLADAGKTPVALFISAALQFSTSIFFLLNWYDERTNRVERAEDARLMHEEVLRERAVLLQGGNHNTNISSGEACNGKEMHPETGHQDEEADPYVLHTHAPALYDNFQVGCGEAINDGKLTQDALQVPEPTPCMCGIFEINKEVITRNVRVFMYCIVISLAAIAMLFGNMFIKGYYLLGLSVGVSSACCLMSFWALPLVIAKANVFMFLQMLLYIRLPGALDNFYQAGPACLEGGPNFSNTFYITIVGVIGNVASIAGITLFNYTFSRRNYRITFIVTTIIQIVASVFDIVMVNRWNKMIGIPDRVMYICGDAIIGEVVSMLGWMPMIVLLSKLCPRGSESMVYAIMAALGNLAQNLSSSIGAVLMEFVWAVKVSETECDFSNVPMLLLVGHMLLPLLVVPLTILLPNVRVCDDLNVDGSAAKSIAKSEMNKERNN